MAKKSPDQYSEQETAQRLEAALRGAREVGHKQLKDISPKRPVNDPKRAAKAKKPGT